MHKLKRFIFLLVVFQTSIGIQTAFGQTVHLSGKVTDKNTGEPVPFANLWIDDGQARTIADLNGNFTIQIPRNTDRLNISCMGYKPVQIQLPSGQKTIKVELEQDVIQLETVDVKPLDPMVLLREAMQKIPDNYGPDSTSISGYYHNFSVLGEKNLRYTEAFIEIFKPPFLPHDSKKHIVGDSILVREVRTKPSEIEDWKVMIVTPWELGIYLLQGRDVARDFTSSFMSNSFLGSYNFELEDMVSLEGRPTYKIRLEPRKFKKNGIWDGHLFIDEETKAFVKIDFKSNQKLFRKLVSDFGYIVTTNLYRFHYKEGEWREVIQYKFQDGIWYLDEINSGKSFIVTSKKREMDNVPLVQKLHYKTSSLTKNPMLPDSAFLSPDLGRAGKFFETNYRPEFWRAFDNSRGIEMDDRKFGLKNNFPDQKPYQITRLDTLKGTLTSLRTSFDVGYYHLDVEVFPEDELIRGSSLIKFRVTEPTDKIQIDLYSGMAIDSIVHRSKSLDFEREYDAVYVSFQEELSKDAIEEIKVYFGGRPLDVDPMIPMYASFLWVKDENGNPWIQAVCQGYGASGWWPNKDHLSDEPDSAAISITFPSDLVAVANGRMVDLKDLENGKTRSTWHISYPINNYNITLNIGKYAQVSKLFPSLEGELDVEYHVLDYHRDNAQSKIGLMEKVLATYEKYFGPYPFPRDGVKIVETPHAMEHQSAVALGYEYFRNEEKEKPDFAAGLLHDQILLHEFAHEWWGNNISCTDNAELWIHEAFATYAEAIFIEEHYGYEDALAYLNAMKSGISNKQPVIGHFGINHVHYDIWDMYAKGALFLNTLRHVIANDPLWFGILKRLQQEYKLSSIDTEQLITYFNAKTGMDLRPVFDQYLRLTEIPELQLQMEENPNGNTLLYRWDSNTEGFDMRISYHSGTDGPKWLYPSSDWQKLELGISGLSDLNFHTDRFYVEIKPFEFQRSHSSCFCTKI